MRNSQYSLDITSDTCPLTMVKTKLLIEEMHVGEIASIRLNGGEPLDNVPRTLRDHGHEVLEIKEEEQNSAIFVLMVKKGADRY
ncbi:MAG: sulfurtransferase TusA family protein [Geminicoccales bacterium]